MIRNPIRYYQLNINEEFQSRTMLKNRNSRIEKSDYYIDLNVLPEQKTETFYYGTTNMTLVSFFREKNPILALRCEKKLEF